MSSKLPTGEMLRLACWYAQQDREAYLDSIKGVEGFEEDEKRTKEFIEQVKAYRIARWGKSKGDLLETYPLVNVMNLFAEDGSTAT